MTDKELKYLSDISQAIALIEEFISTITSFEEYSLDLKTQSAVERQLGIIGEAINKFESLNQKIILNNSRQIIGFRNRLIHAYDAIENSMVWVIIKKHLDTLKIEVNEILQINPS